MTQKQETQTYSQEHKTSVGIRDKAKVEAQPSHGGKTPDAYTQICFHLMVKPSRDFLRALRQKEGSGNCQVCNYDPNNNPRCSNYLPHHVRLVEVQNV